MTHLSKYVSYLWQSYRSFKVYFSFPQYVVVAFCVIESIIDCLLVYFCSNSIHAHDMVLGCQNLTAAQVEVFRILIISCDHNSRSGAGTL